MIKTLSIRNFKSHRSTELELSNLTVLCGSNGVGKSSVIQSLLLLRESFLQGTQFNYLNLKTNAIDIGFAKDAIYQFASENKIVFDLQYDSLKLLYNFETDESSLGKSLIYKSESVEHFADKDQLIIRNLFNKNFQFISAARLGPQTFYQKDDAVADINNQISLVEGRAEHFIHYLMVNKDKSVIDILKHPSEQSSDLFYQVTAWEREICSGVHIYVEDLGNIGYELKYQFATESTDGKTDLFKSINVGFGLSYVLPIIVAILSSPKGALLLIENPEAHIHPRSQSKLTELICLAAEAGIQIIIETHSDHIINGILVQCKRKIKSQVGISHDNVRIYQFLRNDKNHSTESHRVNFDENGTLIDSPEGFFDQIQNDLEDLLGF